jgi:AraC-like DNA-binding protein
MKYWYQKSIPGLTSYIQTVLVLNGVSKADNSDQPLFTNGMPALLYQTDNCSTHTITLFGKSIPSENWKIENNNTLVAFFFKPFTLGTIFKLSAEELKDNPIELQRWNAQKSMALSVQLIHTKTTEEKVNILNQFILAQLQTNQRACGILQFATDQILLNPNAEVLAHIVKELHLTERTFQRIFKYYVGITANEYRRICQFYFSFSQLKGRHFQKQTDVAYSNGYFDQSHFIRSFREFTDTTPNDYLEFGLSKQDE